MLRLVRTLVARSLYSTQEKKNVVVIPKRYEVTLTQFQDVDTQIQISPNCKTLAVLVKENLQLFTDRHITNLFKHIGQWDLEIDDSFHTIIAPIAVEWVKTFNRGNAPSLFGILATLTYRNISSPELEQLVVKKLDQQNIYRYLDLRETAALFLALSKHPRYLKHSLFTKIQHVLYQQKLFYSQHPDLLEAIREGMAAVQANVGQKPLEIQQAYKQIV